MHLITIPGHNFVRWILDADNALNFETMDGKITDDGYYINGWGYSSKICSRRRNFEYSR